MSIGEIFGVATVVVIILVAWCGMYALHRAAGKRGNRKQDARIQLRQHAAQLDEHHAIHWRYSPTHLRGTIAGWPVAANAMHSLCRSAPVDVFPFPSRDEEAEMLASWWGITTSTQLREQLLSLLRNGHRERFDEERRYWSGLQGAEQRRVRNSMYQAAQGNEDAAEDFLRFRRVCKNTRDLMSIDFLAWDLVRVIMLSRAGVTAGLIDEDEAVDTALIASQGLQEQFASWQDMGGHFFRGRWYWASESDTSEALRAQHDDHAQRVLSTNPGSPWNAVPWQAPLPSPKYLLLDNVRAAPLPSGSTVAGEWRNRLEREISVGSSSPDQPPLQL
ncbi:DUF1266 domain-containing protein [Actinomycetaceae bacterium L2_0104]